MNLIIFLIGVTVGNFIGAVIASLFLIHKYRSKSAGDLCIATDDEDGSEYVFLRAKVPISELKKTTAVSFEVLNIKDSR